MNDFVNQCDKCKLWIAGKDEFMEHILKHIEDGALWGIADERS